MSVAATPLVGWDVLARTAGALSPAAFDMMAQHTLVVIEDGDGQVALFAQSQLACCCPTPRKVGAAQGCTVFDFLPAEPTSLMTAARQGPCTPTQFVSAPRNYDFKYPGCLRATLFAELLASGACVAIPSADGNSLARRLCPMCAALLRF